MRPRSTINPADVVSKRHPPQLAPVFSHRLTAYKIVEHFFGLSYQKISGSNQVKNSFFRISNISVPCLHAQLRVRGRTVIINKKLWTFFGPWRRDRSQSPLCWIFRVKQIHPSTASERMTRQPPQCVTHSHRSPVTAHAARLTSCLLKKHAFVVCLPSSDCLVRLVVYNQFVTPKKCLPATFNRFLR